MTPFISDAVLKRLPSLPKQHALVFGTSVNLPTTFKVREASPLPHSDDTRIVDLVVPGSGPPRQYQDRLMELGHEEMASALEASGDYRVLRRLQPRMFKPDFIPSARLALYVDVETTGLDPRQDEIIELGHGAVLV